MNCDGSDSGVYQAEFPTRHSCIYHANILVFTQVVEVFCWGRVRVSVKKAELGMGQKVLLGCELNELKMLRCGFCAFRQNITCGFILKIAETPDSGSDP